ncbi:glutamic acid-rich protein-like [Centruroides sculpturatus]|uniref:glutamic acid-rich protein-like n=1 Tax=Centruroides sculpturatus TaxID=218467 RepID=UPI000C6E5612|nr:glutamic acid-rich protein-like [Centruroides sculpturatus]
MDFNYLSSISQFQHKTVKSNQNFKTKSSEKKTSSSQVTSNAIQAFLARKQEEERQKYEEAKRRKEKLLTLRAQNSKSNKKAKIMASRTKDNDFSKIKLTEDEVEAKIKREQELNKKRLTNTVDRMKARIQLEERDNQLPRTRKKKTSDSQRQTTTNSPMQIEYKFNGNSAPIPVLVNKKKDIEKRKQVSKSKSAVMDYRNLLEIAAKKQFEAGDDSEYEDFEEESDEYEEEQIQVTKTSLPSYNTKEDESVHRQINQNSKLNNKILADKHKLKQNKENSYNTNNSLKNEILQESNMNHKQLNKSYKKNLPNNKTPKLYKSNEISEYSQKMSSYNNNLNFTYNKNKVPSKPNKYEEYIRTPDDKLHSEEEYIPQYQKPALIPNLKSVQNQKELNYIPTNKSSVKNRNDTEILNNRKKIEQTSIQNMTNRVRHSEKIISSNLDHNINVNRKYLDSKKSKDVSKHKNELFKIPKKKKECDAMLDDSTPCYYTGDNDEKNVEIPKSHNKVNNVLKQNSEKRHDYINNKKREIEERFLLNNKINNRIPNNIKQSMSSRNNLYVENKFQEKLKNSTVRRNIQNAKEFEEPKQYFTINGEEKSKYDTSKSLMKSKHSKNSSSASNEVYQYFTEDFKKEQSTSKNINNTKCIINNHRTSMQEKDKIKSMANAHKLSQNRSEIKRNFCNEYNRDRSESPPAKIYKSESIRNENRINQRIEKSNDQRIVKRKLPIENKKNEHDRFKSREDDYKRDIGRTNEKVDREFSAKSLNAKIKSEYRIQTKTEKDNYNSINTVKSKYPEYTSVPKVSQESKNKSNFVQKESAFPKKVLAEKKRVIPPSSMVHLMQKEQIQTNNKLRHLEKQRLEKERPTIGKLQMITKSENLSRMENNRKILKSNSNTNISKHSERNTLNEKPIPSKRFPQPNNGTIPNKNFKPITSADYVGIKRDRQGRPLVSMFLRKNVDSDEEEEDEEEDDDDDMADFIDDGPLEEDDEDYSRYIREIFGYDKRRYRYEEEFDDQAMESSYAEQMKEERRSARIGLLEDLEDMKKEEEEKQQKALKKKR